MPTPGSLGRPRRGAIRVFDGGTEAADRAAINLIEGSNVTLTIADNPTTGAVDVTVAATGGGGGGGGAPTGASYVTLGVDSTLTAERVLVAGTALTLSDGGAGGNVTLAVQLGTSGTTACAGNDSRLSDSRTPTAHDAQHDPHIMARVAFGW